MQYTQIKHIFFPGFRFTSEKLLHISDKQNTYIVTNQIKSPFDTIIMHNMESQYNM
jgi:hypothetical protein